MTSAAIGSGRCGAVLTARAIRSSAVVRITARPFLTDARCRRAQAQLRRTTDAHDRRARVDGQNVVGDELGTSDAQQGGDRRLAPSRWPTKARAAPSLDTALAWSTVSPRRARRNAVTVPVRRIGSNSNSPDRSLRTSRSRRSAEMKNSPQFLKRSKYPDSVDGRRVPRNVVVDERCDRLAWRRCAGVIDVLSPADVDVPDSVGTGWQVELQLGAESETTQRVGRQLRDGHAGIPAG